VDTFDFLLNPFRYPCWDLSNEISLINCAQNLSASAIDLLIGCVLDAFLDINVRLNSSEVLDQSDKVDLQNGPIALLLLLLTSNLQTKYHDLKVIIQ